MNIKIFYEDDTELAEFEALNRGVRRDVIVEVDNKKYKINIPKRYVVCRSEKHGI